MLVSAGDFYGTSDVFTEPKSHFVARMMAHMGYDAVGVGELELGYGLDGLVEDVRDHGLNVTCANILTRADREAVAPDSDSGRRGLQAARRHGTVFPPYLVVERGGVRFGFVGLLSPATKVRGPGAANTIEAITWVVVDPLEAAARIVPEVREKCDVLVVLAHMDAPEIGELAAAYPQIDVFVAGHDLRLSGTAEPGRVGEALMFKATSRGQNVGVARIEIDGDGRIVDVRNRIHYLDASYGDHPETVAMIDAFEKENRERQKVLYAKQQLRSAGGAEAKSDYLGVGACQKCHLDEFRSYAATAHARAYRTLAARFVHRDANCVGCHVTGFEEEGGFSGVRMRGAELDLVDVQCEACHGPGAVHSRDGRYLSSAVESCTRCHTEREDPDFDFERDWEKIAH